MSKIILSYLFKTNLAAFRSAIHDDNTGKICRILDIERDYLNREIDHYGNTALILAIQHASPLTVRLLLEHGAQPDRSNEIMGHTPLGVITAKVYEDYNSHKAQRTLEMARILLDYGAYVDKPSLRVYTDENEKDYFGKETPLMTAVRNRNLPLATLLVDRKANVNSTERQSQIRAIHLAVTNGDEVMYDLLERAGALVASIVTEGENTLLHWFCYKKENDQHSSLLHKILDKGCNIDAQNHEQLTPLMIAARNDMIETCRVLLKNKVQTDKRDSNGCKAIDLATAGSQCSKLLHQEENIQRSKPNSSFLLKDKVLWRKRLDSGRRSNYQSSETDTMGRSIEAIPSRFSEGERGKGHTDRFLRPPMYPTQKRHSGEMDTKPDCVGEKSLQTTAKRRTLKSFCKKRARSVEPRNRYVN